VGQDGFEPPKTKSADLQSAPFGHSGIAPRLKKSQRRDSNPRPTDYKSVALPAELLWLILVLKERPFVIGVANVETILIVAKKNKNFFRFFSCLSFFYSKLQGSPYR